MTKVGFPRDSDFVIRYSPQRNECSGNGCHTNSTPLTNGSNMIYSSFIFHESSELSFTLVELLQDQHGKEIRDGGLTSRCDLGSDNSIPKYLGPSFCPPLTSRRNRNRVLSVYTAVWITHYRTSAGKPSFLVFNWEKERGRRLSIV